MIIKLEKFGDFDSFREILKGLDDDISIQGIMIFTCDANQYNKEILDPLLVGTKKPLFGGVYPAIIHSQKKHDKGTIFIGFTVPLNSQIIHQIDDTNRRFTLELEKMIDSTFESQTVFINVDGLSTGVEAFKEELFYSHGLGKNYIGGGSGSLSFSDYPNVISNEGLLKDCAVLAFVNIRSGVGVSHGWETVSSPMKITETNGNKIITINWEPAFHFYRTVVEGLSKRHFCKDEFFSIAKGYPFGISKMGNEMVVRDPIGVTEENAIICVGEVPQNSFVYILNGNKDSLLVGSKNAKLLAEKAYNEATGKASNPEDLVLFIDCISRVLFLGDDFQDELDGVSSPNLIGALTLGEIANTGKAFLELYNKTSVIGILEGTQ